MQTPQRAHFPQNHFPVHAHFNGAAGEWESTGIDFADYGRMSMRSHKQSAERRLETPLWVFSKTDLRDVITLATEIRAGVVTICDTPTKHVKSWRGGTEAERVARAEKKMLDDAARYEEVLKELCADYATSPDAAARDALAARIEHIDQIIKSYRAGAKLFAALIYNYYHLSFDSVGTALACGMRPPLVRQNIFRLNRVWETVKEIRSGERKLVPYKEPKVHAFKVEKLPRAERVRVAVCLHRFGLTWDETVKCVGYSHFESLRRNLIKEGLHKPTNAGWDGKKVIDRAAAIALREQGLSQARIAKQLGCGEWAVWNALRGCTAPCIPIKGRQPYVKIDAGQMAKLFADGWTQAKIARHFGCSNSAVHYTRKRMMKNAAAVVIHDCRVGE